jgi:hypothetical protein
VTLQDIYTDPRDSYSCVKYYNCIKENLLQVTLTSKTQPYPFVVWIGSEILRGRLNAVHKKGSRSVRFQISYLELNVIGIEDPKTIAILSYQLLSVHPDALFCIMPE